MPTMSSVSSKYPALTCVTMATTGAESSRLTSTVSPLPNRVLRTVSGASKGIDSTLGSEWTPAKKEKAQSAERHVRKRDHPQCAHKKQGMPDRVDRGQYRRRRDDEADPVDDVRL